MKLVLTILVIFWSQYAKSKCFESMHFWTRPYSIYHSKAIINSFEGPEEIMNRSEKIIRKELKKLNNKEMRSLMDDLVQSWLTKRKNLPGLALLESELHNYDSFQKIYTQAVVVMRKNSISPSDIGLNHIIKNIRSVYVMNLEMAEDFINNPHLWQQVYAIYINGLHETLVLDEMLSRLHLGVWDKMFKIIPGIKINPDFDFLKPIE